MALQNILSEELFNLQDEDGRPLLAPRAPAGRYKVKTISTKGGLKKVTLEAESGARFSILLQRFALVGEKDVIDIRDEAGYTVSCVGEEGAEIVPIFPAYQNGGTFEFAGECISWTVAEITSPKQLEDYAALEEFHYRGIDLSRDPSVAKSEGKKSVGGRRAVLMLQLMLRGAWASVGYIEIQMPLMMAKPRHNAFNRAFEHPTRKVSWTVWKKGGETLVNRIARIARVVVHPEFRGLSLSDKLVQSAIEYARDRWHIAGARALFLEISAEMLKHIDFVSRCGFSYLGDTEGNKERLTKDLRSLNNGAGGKSGIMSVQRKYYAQFESFRKSIDDSFESLRARLSEILSYENPWEVMTVEEWLALRPLIRSQLPYYMIGLDPYCDDYVKAAALPSQKAIGLPALSEVRSSEVRAQGLELWSDYEVPVTKYTRLVMDGFGITAKTIKARLLGPVSLTATPGTITFVAGSSGCGKSLLLSCLDPAFDRKGLIQIGELAAPERGVGWLQPLRSDVPIFEHFADAYGPERAFDVLSRVGLSEAMLFIKPFEMLSRGQRYRAMLADLLMRPEDVWLVDEFCSDLDPLSAKIVAHRFRQSVMREGRTAFVAAANHQHFITALKPTRVVLLSATGPAKVMTWKEYRDGFLD